MGAARMKGKIGLVRRTCIDLGIISLAGWPRQWFVGDINSESVQRPTERAHGDLEG